MKQQRQPAIDTLLQDTHASLAPLIPILTSFAHRNHNQHRSSHWWSAFSILRRSLKSLDTAVIKHRRDSARAQVHWISSHVVPRAYLAFSQLAADNQHAALGLMLLAVLARVHAALRNLEPESQPEPVADTNTPKETPSASAPDMGVAVSRDALLIPKEKNRSKSPSREPKSLVQEQKGVKLKESKSKDSIDDPQDARPKKKKKKSKKGGDELSSLFGSL